MNFGFCGGLLVGLEPRMCIAGVHIMLQYLWQIVLLRLEVLKAPAKWLGISIISANDPAYDLVPKVSPPSQGLVWLPCPPSLQTSQLYCAHSI